MPYRTFTRARLLLGVFLSVVGFVGAHAQTAQPNPDELTPEVKQEVLTAMSDLITKSAYVPGADFSKWPDFLAKQQEAVDKAKNAREFVTAVNGALRQFGVSHIVFATPEQARARRDKQVIGIGVSLQIEPDGMRVVNLFSAAPAAQAGIQIGDLIIEADGKKPLNPGALTGDAGTTVKLKVRKIDGKTVEYSVTRAKFSSVRPETLSWPTKDTALLRIYSFDAGYNRKNVEDLMKAAAGAKQLILDLRSNGGGAVTNFVHLLGLMMKADTPIGTFVSRTMVERFIKETGGKATDTLEIAHWSDSKVKAGRSAIPPFKGKIAVLVNGGTGSASEIVAAALQEILEAPVVGSKSAGAVLVSIMRPLPQGYQLQYPISDFVTMHGVRLEGTGVIPDVEAPLTKYNEKDAAVDKAIALLHRSELRDERFGAKDANN
jgi:carboxyl-terminal processing protease